MRGWQAMVVVSCVIAVGGCGSVASTAAPSGRTPAASFVVITPAPSGEETPSASASPTAKPSSTGTIVTTPSGEPAHTLAPTLVPTHRTGTKTQTKGLIVKWQGDVNPGFGKVHSFRGVAQSKGRFVAVGNATKDMVAAMWSSTDGRTWTTETMPTSLDEYAGLTSVAGNEAGIVVVGDNGDFPVLWFSSEASTWLTPDPGTQFEAHVVVATADRFITFGWKGELFTSTDGAHWQQSSDGDAATVAAGLEAATAYGADSWAFSKGGMTGDLDQPVGIWRSVDGLDWALIGELPDSRHDEVIAAAAGPNGIAAVGAFKAWYSPDGFSWTPSTRPPNHLQEVIADSAGFVGVGANNLGGGCVKNEIQDIGVTWTSVDGDTWVQMPDRGWLGTEVDVLTSAGRTLIGLGVDYIALRAGENNGMVWTSALPDVATNDYLSLSSPEPVPSTGC